MNGRVLKTRLSFSGWDWLTWLKGNKDSVKIIASLVFGYLVTNGLVEAGLVAILSKAVLDLIDYFASKQVA